MPLIETSLDLSAADDVSLVRIARGGDAAAFEELVRRYSPKIFRLVRHITRNHEDAEDVVQDAFLKAFRRLDQFQGKSRFSTWLFRIGVNESLMRLRKRQWSKEFPIEQGMSTETDAVPCEIADWGPNPEQRYSQLELKEILAGALQALPFHYRTVFLLRDVEGLSIQETAEALELSTPAVKTRLMRARLRLRERLSKFFVLRAGQSSFTQTRLGVTKRSL